MDVISAVGVHAPGKTRSPGHLRRLKVAGAVAVSLLAGLGAYTVTHRALVLVSQPSGVPTSQSPAPPHLQAPLRHTPFPDGVGSSGPDGQSPSSEPASRTMRLTSDCSRAQATSGWSCTNGRNCQAASA